VAHELTLSFVPDVTQRLWRTVTRRKYQSTCNRVGGDDAHIRQRDEELAQLLADKWRCAYRNL
jgi:hypothetical protein